MLIKVSPHRMRAMTERLSQWFPAEATMYRQNRHPEARIAASLLNGAFGGTFFEEYSDERLPNFSAHAPDAPIFVAIATPGTDRLLERASTGAPILDPINLAGVLQTRLLIPSRHPQLLVDAIDTYCNLDDGIRRLGGCDRKVGARAESGYLVLDTATSMNRSPLQRRAWLRGTLGYDVQSSEHTSDLNRLAPTAVGPTDVDTPEFDGLEATFLTRNTPARRRFVQSHRAFEFYARTDDLWYLLAAQTGLSQDGSHIPYADRLKSFPRASLRAAAALAAADPGGREIEDLHLTVGLGPGGSVKTTASGTWTQLGRQYVPDGDATPSFKKPDIQRANLKISWDTRALQPFAGVELPEWITNELEVTELFDGDAETAVVEPRYLERNPSPFARSGVVSGEQWFRGTHGQLVALSQPTAISAVSNAEQFGRYELFELLRLTGTRPVAGHLEARFGEASERHRSPVHAIGVSMLTPTSSPTRPNEEGVADVFQVPEDSMSARVQSDDGVGRIEIAAQLPLSDVFGSAGSARQVTREDDLSELTIDIQFASIFQHLLERPEDLPYGREMWLQLARAGEFHARAGRRPNEVAGVATLGPIPSMSAIQMPPASGGEEFEATSPSRVSDATVCRREWVRNLIHAAANNWLRREDGLGRLAQLGHECTDDAATDDEWLERALGDWALVLSQEAAAVANFDVALEHARLACQTHDGHICSSLTSLTRLADQLQLPNAAPFGRFQTRSQATHLDTNPPLATSVSLTPGGLYIGPTHVADLDTVRQSHLQPGTQREVRAQLIRQLRRRRDQAAGRRLRQSPMSAESVSKSQAYLAIDRRTPTGLAAKVLQLMPGTDEVKPDGQPISRFVATPPRSATNTTILGPTELRTTAAPHNKTAYVHIDAGGIGIDVPGGTVAHLDSCPTDGPTICPADQRDLSADFLAIEGTTFGSVWGDTDDAATRRLKYRPEERGGFVADNPSATSQAIARVISTLRLRKTAGRLNTWIETRGKELAKQHDGYGDPPSPLDQIILDVDPKLPWAVTLRMYAHLLRVSPPRGHRSDDVGVHLARPTLDWTRGNQDSKAGEDS
jgi:hypothetical protein